MTRGGKLFLVGSAGFGLIVNIAVYGEDVWGVVSPYLTEARVRDWLAALSGWVAAAVAGFTILPLYRQLRHQQRQTDFQLGDALPTIDVTPDLDDSDVMVVRLVNWNRRGMIVHKLGTNIGKSLGLHEVKLDGTVVDLKNMRWPIPLRGWENRSVGPHTVQLKIFADAGEEILREWPSDAKVILGIQILADTHTLTELSASVHP